MHIGILRTTLRTVALCAAGTVLMAAPALAATSHPAPTSHPGAFARRSVTPDSTPSDCPGGWVCIYASRDWSGGPGKFMGTNPSWGAELGSSHDACVAGQTAGADNKGGWNDCVSAIYDNNTISYSLYLNTHCSDGGGIRLPLAPAQAISNLATYSANGSTVGYWNDRLTSDKTGGGGGC
ncbi:MAG TPA: peptidase inhibitor family I36 protein [Streptosporangiaceae bacterium]|nr:peptidase inhibitor family I36 protein [Streptosporangiaceae bacterium]